MQSILEAAIKYQKAGLWVLPLKPKEKIPHIKWKERVDKRPDEAEIREWFAKWPDANVGCLTGKYSGVDVLDIDSQEALETFQAIVGNPYETCYQETGKGYHFFFENNGNKIKNAAALGGINGIDIRTTGGIVVLSPSVHPSGRVYAWGNDGMIDEETGFDEVSKWPEDIIEWVEKKCAHIGSCEYTEESDMSQAFMIAQSRGFDMHQFADLNDIHLIRAVALKSESDTPIDRAGLLFVLDRCLFADGHESGTSTKGEASIGITSTGMLFYQCFHGSCHGKKWDDVAEHFGYSEPRVEIMTAEDIAKEASSKTLHIPSELYDNRGLISSGLDAIADISSIDLIQYIYPSVLISISKAISGKICCGSVYPSCFFVKVGRTSTGKTQSDTALEKLITPFFLQASDDGSRVINAFYGPNRFSSGPGFLKAVEKNANKLFVMDEITYLFAPDSVTTQTGSGIKQEILELSTASGKRLEKFYADESKNVVIENTAVNLIGNATPLIYKALTLDDFQSGLVQRFDFFAYDGKIPYRREISDTGYEKGRIFAERIHELCNVKQPMGLTSLIQAQSVDVGMTPEASKIMKAFSDQITDIQNDTEDDGLSGILSRRYDAAIKYALIHSAATRAPEHIFNPLSDSDVEYGLLMSKVLADWKVKTLFDNVAAGEFDAMCCLFIEAVKIAVTAKQQPTFKFLCNRRKKLRNLNKRDREMVIDACVERGAVIVDKTGRSETYYPAKM